VPTGSETNFIRIISDKQTRYIEPHREARRKCVCLILNSKERVSACPCSPPAVPTGSETNFIRIISDKQTRYIEPHREARRKCVCLILNSKERVSAFPYSPPAVPTGSETNFIRIISDKQTRYIEPHREARRKCVCLIRNWKGRAFAFPFSLPVVPITSVKGELEVLWYTID